MSLSTFSAVSGSLMSTVFLAIRVIWLASGVMPASARAFATVAVDGRIAGDLELVLDAFHVVGARLQGHFHQLLLVDGAGRDEEQALVVEHPGHAAGAAQLAVGKLEDLADFAGRAIAVVGEHFAEDGHAAGAVALVDDFFEVGAFQFAGAAFDRPLDVLLGHADGLGVVDGVAEPQVGVGIAAAVLGRDDDRLGQLAPELAALGVDQRLLVFNARPM